MLELFINFVLIICNNQNYKAVLANKYISETI